MASEAWTTGDPKTLLSPSHSALEGILHFAIGSKGDWMNRFQQGSLFKVKRKRCAGVWVFRWYDYTTGRRIYKKQIIGTTGQLRSRRDAEKAVVALRGLINVDVGTPRTVCDLDAHYRAHELAPGRKSFSTTENQRLLFKRYIEPRWGHFPLNAIRTVEVEEWLHSLPLAPASKAKLKCLLSVL